MLSVFIITTIFAVIISSFGIPFGISFIGMQILGLPVYFIESIFSTRNTSKRSTEYHYHTYNDHRVYHDSRSIHVTDKNDGQSKKISPKK